MDNFSIVLKKIDNVIRREFRGEIKFRLSKWEYLSTKKDVVAAEEIGKSSEVLLFDTSIGSDNQGDLIICDHCVQELNRLNIGVTRSIPTHIYPTAEDEAYLLGAKLKFVAGTNIISGRLNYEPKWKLPSDFKCMEHLCLLGTGLGIYEQKFNSCSKWLLGKMLQPEIVHAVRDSQTQQRLKSIGIENVYNTACPTMWQLDEDYCKSIPTEKARSVITTITDYNRNPLKDTYLINTLCANYDSVYLYLQGHNDYEYIKSLSLPSSVRYLYSLQQFREILKSGDIEYIGTRLHAGIEALNYGVRSMVIAVDDRARMIATDTGLPIVERDNLTMELDNVIKKKRATEIHIPLDNINLWRESVVKLLR